MFYLAHENGVPYTSEYHDSTWLKDSILLKAGPLGAMETRIMVERGRGETSGRLRHFAWVTNKDEPGLWRPLSLKMAKYVLEQLIKDGK